MKVSRVIAIVVALHVLVIGGIFVFEGCSRARVQSPQLAENEIPTGDFAGESLLGPDAAPVAPEWPAAMQPVDGNSVLPQPAPGVPPQMVAPAIPAPTPEPIVAAPVSTTYAVKAGDSLWKISRNEGLTVAELAQANNISEKSMLQIGQVLTIPGQSAPQPLVAAPAAVAAPSFAPEAGGLIGGSYQVKRGDSLWKIARANGTTVGALKELNQLNGDMLKIGQQLQLPVASTSSSVAPTPAPSARATIAPSGYHSEWNEPGRVIKENGKQYHVVDWNQSLGEIAQKYGITIQQLQQANGLNNIQIHPGQRLEIPARTDDSLASPILNANASGIQ